MPLPILLDVAPKIVSHADGRIRDLGISLLAEICRVYETKDLLADVIATLKPTQANQLDAMLESKPQASQPKISDCWVTSSSNLSTPPTASSVMEELEQQRLTKAKEDFKSREPVDLIRALASSAEYKSKMKAAKWSEKVGALNILISCAGPKPYKLTKDQDYKQLVVDLKKLLSHTHFSVCNHSMKALEVLFEGVGAPLYPHAKPVVKVILDKAKDKKLTAFALRTLKCIFGRCVGFSDVVEDVELNCADKNSIKRLAGWQWVGTCVESAKKGTADGSKGSLQATEAISLSKLCASSLATEADAEVKKVIVSVVKALLSWDDNVEIVRACKISLQSLESANPRVYASLMAKPSQASASALPPSNGSTTVPDVEAKPPKAGGNVPKTKQPTKRAGTSTKTSEASSREPDVELSYEEASEKLSSLSIPDFDADADAGGILAGLSSSSWQLKKAAIDNLAEFARSSAFDAATSPSFVAVLKKFTRSFKDSNFNVMKSVYLMIAAMIVKHDSDANPVPFSLLKIGATLGVEKIADRKLSEACKNLLVSTLVTASSKNAKVAVEALVSALSTIKSPTTHESALKFFHDFAVSNGAKTLGAEGVKLVAGAIVKYTASNNVKVRSASTSLAGVFHKQIGLSFKMSLLGLAKAPATVTALAEAIEKNPYDASAASDGDDMESDEFSVPRSDLSTSLPKDILSKLSMTDGKNAWKYRKEALDQIAAAVKKAEYLISGNDFIHELLRSLRARLNDSQSNLKPLAAGVTGDIIFALDSTSAAKYFKVSGVTLLSSAMNDNKKMMRDAALTALDKMTKISQQPDGINDMVVQNFLFPFVSALRDDQKKVGVGLPDILSFVLNRAAHFAKFDPVGSSTKLRQLEQQLSMELLRCMCSAKAEVRSSGEKLMITFIEEEVITSESVNRGLSQLKPAQQRDVGAVVSKFTNLKSRPSATSHKPAVAAVKTTAHDKRKVAERKVSSTLSATRSSKTEESAVAEPRTGHPSTTATAASEHPFFGSAHVSSYIGKDQRTSSLYRKRENWPDFPDLPDNELFGSTLKKNWAPLLDSVAAATFFPPSGMKKQDDSIDGCGVICRAIAYETSNTLETSHVIDQLDLILKYLACAFCSKDNTSGLDAIIGVMTKILDFAISKDVQFSDFEARTIVPIVLEKSAAAKGRFVDRFTALLSKLSAVTQPKTFGSLCVSVVDFSKNQKARAAALAQCKLSVEAAGIGAIGKKGVACIVKGLDENGTDVRNNSLAVLESALIKFGGDVPKLFRICGGGLSTRGQALIVERAKRLETDANVKEKAGIATATTTTTITTPTTKQEGTPQSNRIELPSSGYRRGTISYSSSSKKRSLDLKIGQHSMLSSPQQSDSLDFGGMPAEPDGPFKFNTDAVQTSVVLTPQRRKSVASREREEQDCHGELYKDDTGAEQGKQEQDDQQLVRLVEESSSSSENCTGPVSTATNAATASTGGAASLRARLAAIRNRKGSSAKLSSVASVNTAAAIADANATVDAILVAQKAAGAQNEEERQQDRKDDAREEGQDEQTEDAKPYNLDEVNAALKRLMVTASPTSSLEETDDFVDGKEGLKVIHASLTSQKDNEDFLPIRSTFEASLPANLEILADVLEFSFSPEEICVPLLSVTLACLVAVFRSSLSKLVPQGTLQKLLKIFCKCLLDSRLNSSGSDGDTQQQLLKAVNKLTIQCAVASPRTASIQALLSMHVSLGREEAKMKKICAKVLARVIKAECTTNGKNAFGLFGAVPGCDIEEIVCCLEDYLTESDRSEDARKLGKGLVLAIVGEGSVRDERVERLKKIMIQDLEFDKSTASVILLEECINAVSESGGELIMTEMFPAVTPAKKPAEIAKDVKSNAPKSAERNQLSTPDVARVGPLNLKTPALSSIITTPGEGIATMERKPEGTDSAAKDGNSLANFVAEIGSSTTEDEKRAAILDLKRYCDSECVNMVELSASLDGMGLSSHFKTFVLESLSASGCESKENYGGGPANNGESAMDGSNAKNLSISSRMKYLKSKFNILGKSRKGREDKAKANEDETAVEDVSVEAPSAPTNISSLRERLEAVKRRSKAS